MESVEFADFGDHVGGICVNLDFSVNIVAEIAVNNAGDDVFN